MARVGTCSQIEHAQRAAVAKCRQLGLEAAERVLVVRGGIGRTLCSQVRHRVRRAASLAAEPGQKALVGGARHRDVLLARPDARRARVLTHALGSAREKDGRRLVKSPRL